MLFPSCISLFASQNVELVSKIIPPPPPLQSLFNGILSVFMHAKIPSYSRNTRASIREGVLNNWLAPKTRQQHRTDLHSNLAVVFFVAHSRTPLHTHYSTAERGVFAPFVERKSCTRERIEEIIRTCEKSRETARDFYSALSRSTHVYEYSFLLESFHQCF